MTDLLATVSDALHGRYRVERVLGTGGTATVYLGHDERHHRPVAIKVLHPELARALGTERFTREIEVAARLNHPHILPLLDSGVIGLGPGAPECPFYVMPFVEGESLRERLMEGSRPATEEALRIAREVADALDHAHRHGVIHRDIKPENILLSEGHAVVADFGLARALDEAGKAALTRTGQAVGTPQYMAPEQVSGDHPVDARTDIFALGCTLFEMLTGEPPWSGGGLTATLTRRLAEPAPLVRTRNPEVSPAVEAAVEQALARDPRLRFATAAEFARALGGEVTTPGGGVMRPRAGTRRWFAPVAAGAAVVIALVIALTQFARPGGAEAITALAIAPLEDQGADSTTVYLSDGIRDEVARLLRQIPRLRVIAPSVVAQLVRQQPGITAAELGERLDVGAVLTWTLRRSTDSLRLAAELVGVPQGDLLWSERYTRAIGTLMAMQTELVQSVGDALRLGMTGAERAVLARQPTANSAAYDLYLRGRAYYLRASPLGAARARQANDSVFAYAQRGLARDSSFALAWELMAEYYFLSAYRGWATDFGAAIDSSVILSHRALTLDSTIGGAWQTLLGRHLYLTDEWDSARVTVRTGLRLAPNDPILDHYSAIYLAETEGLLDSAITLMRRAAELEPNPAAFNSLGDLYMRARRYDSAESALRRAIELDPSVPGPRVRLIQTYERVGRFQDAVEARRDWKGEGSAAPFAQALATDGPAGYRRVLEADIGVRIDSIEASFRMPRSVVADTTPPRPEARIALLYGQLGEWEEAMNWVLRERERRPGRFRLWVTHPDMEGLRRVPRFLALVREEGLQILLPP